MDSEPTPDRGNLNERLGAEMRPLADYLAERLNVDDDEWRLVIAGMTKTMVAGARAGASEAVAQLLEEGVEVNAQQQQHRRSMERAVREMHSRRPRLDQGCPSR